MRDSWYKVLILAAPQNGKRIKAVVLKTRPLALFVQAQDQDTFLEKIHWTTANLIVVAPDYRNMAQQLIANLPVPTLPQIPIMYLCSGLPDPIGSGAKSPYLSSFQQLSDDLDHCLVPPKTLQQENQRKQHHIKVALNKILHQFHTQETRLSTNHLNRIEEAQKILQNLILNPS